MNTSRRPAPSNATVSRNEVKNLAMRSTIRVFGSLKKLDESSFFALGDLLAAHEFVKPGLPLPRHNRADKAGRLASFGIGSTHIHQDRLAARHVKRAGHFFEFRFVYWRTAELPAPSRNVRQHPPAFALGGADVHVRPGSILAGDDKFGQQHLGRGLLFPTGRDGPLRFLI